ncbi:MAG: iron transporter [Actinomycetia bacterium]|nr:iron transporter [Actinomycetes bacterium]
MGASLLITLREGLEIALVIAIIASYLVRTGRSEYLGAMWIGAGLAVVVSLITGLVFRSFIGELEGKWEQVIEGALAFLAVGVLTWMIFWMRRNARGISGELHDKIDSALANSPLALTFIAFVAVVREGFETALFLLSAETGSSSGAVVVLGGIMGLGAAAVIGLAFYRGSAVADLRRFFRITGLLMILFAAGLFAKGLHEFRELLEIESSIVAARVWDITSGPLSEGSVLHDFAKGLFGWSPHPERIRVAGYLAYLVPVVVLFYRGEPAEKASAPVEQPVDALR